MSSIKSSVILISFLVLDLSFAQNKIPVRNRMNLEKNGVANLQNKVTIPLKVLMDGKQECPRLQDLGSKLLNDPKHCDIELEVHDSRLNETRVFCAHNSILCMRSTKLNEKITELLKTHTGTQKPRLKIKDLNPDIFQLILQYLYTDKIDPNFDIKPNIMDLFVAADYANLPELNAMIKEYLYDSVDPNEVSNYLKWANKYGHDHMKYFLLDITRTALKMNKNEWRQFVRSMCQSHSNGNGKKGGLGLDITPILKPLAEAAEAPLKAIPKMLDPLNIG